MTTDHSSSETPNPEKDSKKLKQLGNQVQNLVVNPYKKRIMPSVQHFSHGLKEQYRKIDIKNEPRQRRFVVATFVLFLVWLLLVGTLSWSEIFVGIVVAAFTAFLSSNHLVFIDNLKFKWAMPLHVLRYLQVFVVALLRANIDLARRVLSPRLPINPALVEVQTQLKSPLGKLILANSITLTPGTLTVDVVGDHLQVHWVDSTPGEDLEHATVAIAESFERHLQEFIE
jgi:multicomponent Na+:H+ antiporter subunit E